MATVITSRRNNKYYFYNVFRRVLRGRRKKNPIHERPAAMCRIRKGNISLTRPLKVPEQSSYLKNSKRGILFFRLQYENKFSKTVFITFYKIE